MSLANVLSASGLGNVPKAFLIIHKTDPEDVRSEQVLAQTQNALQEAAANSTLKDLSKITGSNAHVLQVQYNPSSLSLQANAEPIPFTYLQQNVDNGIPNQNFRPPMVVLGVELMFDAMHPQDAFMMDKARLSAGTAVSDVSGIVQNVKHGGYTVQPQTEGLVAALLRNVLQDYVGKLDALVLGCTHYPFAAPAIGRILGSHTELLDGGDGTARETHRRLQGADLLAKPCQEGCVILECSGDSEKFQQLATKLLYG